MKEMKLIIAGGRDYIFDEADFDWLNDINSYINIVQVISGHNKGKDPESGMITGADYYGEMWAFNNGIPILMFPADWNKYGTAAGPIRNEQMAKVANAVALFPGGKGTANMEVNANKYNLRIFKRFEK